MYLAAHQANWTFFYLEQEIEKTKKRCDVLNTQIDFLDKIKWLLIFYLSFFLFCFVLPSFFFFNYFLFLSFLCKESHKVSK